MSVTFSIDKVEYEQRRSSFELCQWINEKLEEMRATGRFDQLYFERNDPRTNVKKLVEEAIPLSRLGLYLSTPGSEVCVTCFADNRNHDATIEVTGFAEREFKVEVTTAESSDSVLRRQALSRQGHVHLTGSIWRSGDREIASEGEMICTDEEDQRCVDLMFNRLRAKIEKKDKNDSSRYDENTAFLVYFTEFRAIDPRHRAKLLVRTERYLLETQAKVAGIYYCYTADYSIEALKPA